MKEHEKIGLFFRSIRMFLKNFYEFKKRKQRNTKIYLNCSKFNLIFVSTDVILLLQFIMV
jgi:hypothetical protein